ncbi:Ankyrin repeat-containing protein [Cladophialophora immunda]|nr:Ankyrin repeat-containing protein [Cladophialophora immunda]
MPVPFGFSVGDFVTVIQLTSKIISSLKDVGGSSSEYQHAVIELESLKRLLEKVTQLTITEDNAVQVNALRGLALACEPCLQEFHSKLKSYEASIGPHAPRSSLKGTFHKVKWAFLGSDEFGNFRKFIAMKVLCLTLLLSMHVFESTSNRDSKERAGHFNLLDEIMKIREGMERLELTNQQRGPPPEYQASLRQIQNKVEDVAEILEGNLTPVSNALTSVGRAVCSFNTVLGQIIDFLGSFQRETKIALQRIIQTNMQIYALLLTSQNSPATAPSMLSDSILFEDALGRTVSLPYQWFRHWETFEGLLRAEFKGAPGEAKVLEGQYHLIDTKGAGAIIQKEDWHRTVFDGREDCALAQAVESGDSNWIVQGHWLPEDDEVIWSQSTQDLEVFGARTLPKDPDESAAILAVLESTDMAIANEDISILEDATQTIANNETLPTPYEVTVRPNAQQPVAEQVGISDNLSLTFETPLDKWLAQTESVGLDPNVIPTTPFSDTTRQDEEASGIEHFKRVHIKQWKRTPDDETANDRKWKAEIDQAIYYRNICDRFPLLPSWLAERLAELNVIRAKRLPRAFHARTSSSHSGAGEGLEHFPPGDNLLRQPSVASHGDTSPNQDHQYQEDVRSYANKTYSIDVEEKPTPAVAGVFKGQEEGAHGHVDSRAWESPQEKSFWTGKVGRKRRGSTLSGSSHSNNSLQFPDVLPAVMWRGSSIKTHSSRSVGSTKAGFVMPPPPVDLEKQNTFICNICNKRVFVLRRRDWQTHVLHDLQPYSCIFENCPTPSKTYTSRWRMRTHVLGSHPFVYSYRCRQCPASEERLRKRELHRHIKQRHPEQRLKRFWGGGATSGLMEYFSKELHQMNCCFCDKALPTPDKFITHISQHLERLAFAVLARPYQKWHFYDDFASEGSSAPATGLIPEIADLIRDNSVTGVKQLLKDGILTKTGSGNSALWLASQHGHEVIVWLLLEHGFDANEKDPLADGMTALHYAAQAGHVSVVEMLLKAGADPHAELDHGSTALTLAARHGQASTLRTLLDAYPRRGYMAGVRHAWILAAENGQSECLRMLKSAFEAACNEGQLSGMFQSRCLDIAELICDGIDAAVEQNMQKYIEEVTSYDWSPPFLLDRLRSLTALRTVGWVRLSLGNSSLSHVLLSNPWLERDWLPSNLSFPDGLSDKAIEDIGRTLLGAQHLSGCFYRSTMNATFPDNEALQKLLKQHPEFIQLLYLDFARNRHLKRLIALLRKGLTPHPKTLLTLADCCRYESLTRLLNNFSSHFGEDDKIHALTCVVERGTASKVIDAFIESRSLPTSHSVAADKLLLACAGTGNRILLEELLNQPIPLFSATGIAAAKSAARDDPKLLALLETRCRPVEANNETPQCSTLSDQ